MVQLLHYSMIGFDNLNRTNPFQRSDSQQKDEQSNGISAELLDHLFRGNGVSKRLAHFGRALTEGESQCGQGEPA